VTQVWGDANTSADLLLIGVNTTRAWRHRHGEVSAAQITRVARQLAGANPQQLRVVMVHQPAAVTQAGDRLHLLRGHAEATQAWAAAGADFLVGGHIHLPFTLPLQGLARRLCVVQAGTAVSSRTRPEAANSVNLVRWGAAVPDPAAQGRCHIERWDYARQDQAFVRAEVTRGEPERT
jgi:hypothetical protein